ncbi:MAG: ABC transporter permease [Armatimonadota bacterium]|nr:ABC transporter permease [Armatimonadota bacterium]
MRAPAPRVVPRGPIVAFFRLHRLAAIGGVIVVLFVAAGLLAPWLAPYDPNAINVQATLQPPSRVNLLGTDNQGRDLLSRVLYGARMSLLISLTSVGCGAVVGVALGILAGYYRALDGPIMRLNDVLLAFPGIIVALTIVSILGKGLENVIVAIAIVQVPQYVRLAHGLVLSVKDRVFVEAAVAIGAPDRSIIFRHILPNTLGPIIVQTSLLIPGAIMTAATLSFLGLGVQPPTSEWGAMLQHSLQWARLAPHVMVIPGLALMLVVFGFNVFGDGLRDAMDPRLRRMSGTPGGMA